MNTTSAIIPLILISSFSVILPACAADSDTLPPDILGFDFSPKSVNTTASSAYIKFTAHLTDDLSGFDQAHVSFRSPSDSQSISASFSSYDRVSGTDLDGIYESSVTLPRNSEQGTWTFRSGSLYDRVGNRRGLSRADMTNLGFPVEFEVVSREDTTPPDILGFDFSPKSVNTITSSADIKFIAHLTDDLSGFDQAHVSFRSPSDSQSISASFSSYDRVSGTDLDGIYESSVTLPRNSEQGTWTFRSGSLYDRVGNRRGLSRADMTNLGFPVEFEVVSREDATPPDILGFDFSPKSVNTITSSADIKFTAHLADDQSGIESAYALFFSPSKSESLSIPFYPKDRVFGNDLDGLYESSIALPMYSEQGTWTLEYAWLTDRAGNRRELNRADVIALRFPVEIQVSSKAVHKLYYPDFTDTADPESWRSWLVIQNPSASVANITLSVWSRSGELLFDDAISVIPHGVSAIRPRNLVGSDCSGSAMLTSEQQIMGTCQITRNSNEMCMSYDALDRGSRVLYYPDFTDTANQESWRSWLVLQNPNEAVADIDLEVYSRQGDLLYSGSQTISAHSVSAIRLRSLVGADCAGSAIITSDQPIMGTCQITRNNNLMCMSYTAFGSTSADWLPSV